MVDAAGRLTGIFTLRDVRLALRGLATGARWSWPTTWPPARSLTVTPDDDLHTALRRMTELNIDEIPVVAPDDPARLLGLLSRRELVTAYTSQIEALRTPDPVATS